MLNIGRCRLYAGAEREYSVRTLDLVGRSVVVDMLGLLTLDWRRLARWHNNPSSFTDADFATLTHSGINMFHPAVDLNDGDPHYATRRWLTKWNRFLSAQPAHFLPVAATADLTTAKQEGKISVLLGMQNSDHFRSPDDVNLFYSMGQRLSQLTYNSRNQIGSGCTERQDRGLTELGFEVVERMNALGMVVDVSHAGEQTCMDAFAASSKPVLITHSNCKALMPHPRCKSDEVIKAMANTGGVMGLTCLRAFVSRRDDAGLDDALDHFDHAARVAGVEHIGIGSDTDLGPRGAVIRSLNHPRRVFDITEGLIRRRYTDEQIGLVLGGNFRRALLSILG
jgi:membrane dipeptidase